MKTTTIEHIRAQARALQEYAQQAKAEIENTYFAASNIEAALGRPDPDFGSLRTTGTLEACERANRAAVRLDALIMAAYLDSINET